MKMKINSKDFRVREGEVVNLRKRATNVEPVYKAKEHYQKLLGEHVAQLSTLQELLYASNRHAVLLIFQAMDAAGKDGAIKHVMSGGQSARVSSIQLQTSKPRRIATRFSLAYHPRSAGTRADRYLQPFLLRGSADRPCASRDSAQRRDPGRATSRQGGLARPVSFDRRFEKKHLYVNGTRIIKFFLHLSKEEQRKRFLARIDEPEKKRKFGLADIEERKFWKQYMKAYEECLSATSTRDAPWYVVPADDKENARLIVSQIVLDTFEGLKVIYLKTNTKRRQELQSIRRRLSK
jgi:polyphosphate kinase 2 (PPK2 family)